VNRTEGVGELAGQVVAVHERLVTRLGPKDGSRSSRLADPLPLAQIRVRACIYMRANISIHTHIKMPTELEEVGTVDEYS